VGKGKGSTWLSSRAKSKRKKNRVFVEGTVVPASSEEKKPERRRHTCVSTDDLGQVAALLKKKSKRE